MRSDFSGSARHLRDGGEALRTADWSAAADSFRSALAVDESPQAQEGLAVACYWLGDVDGAVAAQEAAYRLYQAADDRRGAARAATWLAHEYEAGRGQSAIANGWLQRAHRLLAGLDAPAELAWLLFWEAHILLLYRGDGAGARERLQEALRLARGADVREAEMMALGLEGMMMVHEGDLAEGMRRLDEVTTAAVSGELSNRFAAGNACCYVLTTCEEIGDIERASQWLSRVHDHYRPLRQVPHDTYCRNHSVGILLATGRWAEAEDEIGKMERESRVTAPAFVREAASRLGELRRRQGRTAEAEALFAQIETHPRAILGRAWIAFEAGQTQAAVELVERYLRHLPDRDRLSRLPALQLLVEAQAAQGDVAAARAALGELSELAQRLGVPAPRAMAMLAEGIVACASGDHDAGRRHFEDAVLAFGRLGAPYEAARARQALARCLAALGRQGDADREAQRAREELQALGAVVEAPKARPAGGLTAREREVIRLVARGLSNKQIASKLRLSEHTVHRHVGNILTRLDLPSRSAAVAYAAESGLLEG